MRYIVTNSLWSLIICTALTISSTAVAENPPPDFLRSVFPQLEDKVKVEEWRSNPSPLKDDDQKRLIEFFKSLSPEVQDDLRLKVKLTPYLVSRLSFENFTDVLKFSVFEEYNNPDIIKYALLQEIGYIAVKEKSASGKANTFLAELFEMSETTKFQQSRSAFFNGRLISGLRTYVRLSEILLPDIDNNPNDLELLVASMENQLGNNPRKLFIFNNKTEKKVDAGAITYDEHGIPVYNVMTNNFVDGRKHDQCVSDTNEYVIMLVDVLSYPDPKVKMAAVRELRRLSGQNFNFNPVGSDEEQQVAIEKWK